VGAGQQLRSLLRDEEVVAYRADFKLRDDRSGTLSREQSSCHVAAQDFTLVDEAGVSVPVRVAAAELVGRPALDLG
jgi:hypothetical protein